MSVISAHGPNPYEINKYETIDSIDDFSVAIYHCAYHKEPIKVFEHSHEEYEFIFPISTVHLFIHANFKVIGEFGFVYPVNTGVNHGFDHDLNKSSVASVTISKEFMQKRIEKLGYKNVYFDNKFPADMLLFELVREFQHKCREEFPNRTQLNELAAAITDTFIEYSRAAGPKRHIPTRTYDPSIRRVLSYMFLNFRNPDLNLTELANYCGYSVAYFSRVFKQYVGDSPITHLNKLRISEARSLFFNDNLSLSEISEMVGFNNLSTFTEAFKKITGNKPKSFRVMTFKKAPR